jgi:hypothetical protein
MKLDRHVDDETLHGLLRLALVGAEPHPILGAGNQFKEVSQVGRFA